MSYKCFLLILCLGLGACDLDLFNSGCKEIIDGYSLCRTEGRSFFLVKSGEMPEGGGVLHGSVDKIGWNDRYIIALRHATFQGDPDGWMKVSLEEQKIEGPIYEEELDELLGDIVVDSSASAWERLR